MKRLLALVLLLALATPALATSLNFQNPGDADDITTFLSTNDGGGGATNYTWIENTTGGNNYIHPYIADPGSGRLGCIVLKSPYPTTYAASTIAYFPITGAPGAIELFDANKNRMSWGYQPDWWEFPGVGKYELKMVGGNAYYYYNGNLVKNETGFSQNPSYVGFCSWGNTGPRWDDYVYGDSENKNIMGISESDDNMFIILQDIINPASDGVAFGVNGTQVQSTYMPMTWGRGNTTTPLTNQSIQLVAYPSNTVYATYYTGTDTFAGSINVDIKTYLIDANAPDGYYAMYMPGTGAYSNIIMKKSNGATVTFDRDTYSTGDTATVITYVAAGGYWDTSLYSYQLSLYGLTSGYLQNYTITSQSGSFSHAWSSTDSPGVYYAILYATSRSTGKEYILGLDWAELSSYAGYSGIVVNAQNGTPIQGAFVNMTQDGVSGNSTSGFDGNWSSGGVFSTGTTVMINATASGYVPYNYSWIPLAARTVTGLNISMVPSTPSFTGLAIGGVDRDFLYGRPIGGAIVTVRNTTTGEYYLNYTNTWGWYLCYDGSTCTLGSKRPYDVWAYKVGYSNSTTGRAVTV